MHSVAIGIWCCHVNGKLGGEQAMNASTWLALSELSQIGLVQGFCCQAVAIAIAVDRSEHCPKGGAYRAALAA